MELDINIVPLKLTLSHIDRDYQIELGNNIYKKKVVVTVLICIKINKNRFNNDNNNHININNLKGEIFFELFLR
jgi:hypothetical protein